MGAVNIDADHFVGKGVENMHRAMLLERKAAFVCAIVTCKTIAASCDGWAIDRLDRHRSASRRSSGVWHKQTKDGTADGAGDVRRGRLETLALG